MCHVLYILLSDPLVVSEWNNTLPVLKVEDIRGLLEALMGDSEGRRCPSWIWTMNTGVVADGTDKAGEEGTHALLLVLASHLQELSTYNSSKN
jgi:hypothetical protein